MAKYEIPDKIEVPQSVGPFTNGDLESDILGVFEPKQGRELTYLNPIQNNGSSSIVENFDKRIPLGTYTLNNRDYWENNNFNKDTLQPYLTDNLTTVESTLITTPDGEVVVIDEEQWSVDTAWSVDALPFVVNPNNDEIVHLDRYYDKDIDKESYELATEGKINYYLQLRNNGRTEQGNIDIFSERNERTKTNNTTGFGPNFFDYFIDPDGNRGFYLFKLNWGDGTEIEYTDKPKLLESTVIFEHYYDKPGFYSITGIIYQYTGDTYGIKQYEKFQTNILLNPSSNYELNLYEYDNFASVGGVDKESTFAKSLYNIVGINPLTQDNVNASEEVIEKLNTLDKLQILNILGKIDYSLIEPYLNFILPYQIPIDADDGTVIHNGFINNKYKDAFKDTELNDTDITTIKMYKGVKPMWKHLGFETDDSDIPNQNTYWKNIIPNDFDYSNLSGIETNEVTVDDDIGVSKGSKIPRQSYTEIIINSESEQVWDDNYYYPVLPRLNKFGVFEEDVNVETSFGNSSIASIINLDDINDDLILNIDFDQTTTDDLIDKTNLTQINYTQDFEVSLDDDLRIKTDTLIIPDGIEKDNLQQAF